MKDDIVNKLDESKARYILNFFARKAYGSNAEIAVDEDYVCVKISHIKFLLFVFNDHVHKLDGLSDKDYDKLEISYKHRSLWRDILRDLTEAAANGKYIAYLPDVNHLLDSSSSIEEALMQIDLMVLDENEK